MTTTMVKHSDIRPRARPSRHLLPGPGRANLLRSIGLIGVHGTEMLSPHLLWITLWKTDGACPR